MFALGGELLETSDVRAFHCHGAIRAGLAKMTGYVPFVIVSHPRSGSTALTNALGCHSEVCMFGEIFSDDPDERLHAMHRGFLRPNAPIQSGSPYQFRQNGDTFLHNELFKSSVHLDRQAIGFKMFYEHARENLNSARAWHYLAKRRRVRVIHLYRANLLESRLSLMLALRDNWWVSTSGYSCRIQKPITLDPEVCKSYFKSVLRYRKWVRSIFAKHAMLEVEYESDICRNFVTSSKRVQEFLGIQVEEIVPFTKKQSKHKPQEIISNYAELCALFRDTEYGQFFT